MSISDIANDVKSGRKKASDLVDEALKKIKADEHDAVISTIVGRARARAKEIDKKPSGRLAGVPFIAKDNFLTLGGKTTAASNMLKDYEAPYQATVINKLEAEGAICVAKSNLDAWAHGSSTENSDFFVTKNPFDKTRVPGGSSGGSAASVALDIVPFAIGTDTGSSVRLPAAFCNIVGLKPTYGAVSRSGVVAMASSLDVIGAMAKTTEDTALVFDVMAGEDALDSTTIKRDPSGYDISKTDFDIKSATFGIVEEYMGSEIEPAVKDQIELAAKKIKDAGGSVSKISIPSLEVSLSVYYIICPAEVSSNLARYDGQRYGLFAPGAKNLTDSYQLAREQGFGAEAKRRIMIGTHVLSSGYYDAYYLKAQTVRSKLIEEFKSAFKKVDFLLGPVSPSLPFKIGEKVKDPLQMYLADLVMVGSNITGVPSISIPAGFSGGLPVGLQIIAPLREDKRLLYVAKNIEELIR